MKFLVNADEDSISLGLVFARAFSAGVTLLESNETRGRGEVALGQFRSAGIHADLIQRETDWLHAVRLVSRAYHYDLVVEGRMWRRGLGPLVFGVVPQALLSDVRTNLLIAQYEKSKIRRILLAVAGGPSSQQVLRWGGLAAKAFDAQPVLLHVTERPPAMFAGLAAATENLSRFMRSNTVEARAFQIAAQSLRLIGIEPELKLAHGTVVDEVVAEARSGNYDLIVLGSSFAGNPSARLFMESVTDRVVTHAPCPVFIARSSTAAGGGTADQTKKPTPSAPGPP